ncbi:HMA2 domain-containing protein [Photobacterium kasasachensis]|uniref:HMA2 domain-containing protein n=1 Tax=Photobacterium kasasachensis TaxID=2910240 RepID=UPI003D0D47BF
MNTYIHKTNQRLRVRSDFIRQNPKAVKELIADLQQIDAIGAIKHKRYAGSVAISFDDKELDCESLLEILDSHGWTRASSRPTFIENAVTNGTKTFARGMAVMALKRLVGPSVSRVIMSL